MVYKKLLFIFAVIFGLLIGMNCLISKSVDDIGQGAKYKNETPVLKQESSQTQSEQAAVPTHKRAWKRTDPKELEKYGITITAKMMEPSTTDEWKKHIEGNLEKYKVLESEGGQEAIKRMQTNQRDYTKKMDEVEKHIEIVRERVASRPLDSRNQTQLQNLYKIKAIGQILGEKGVIKDGSYVSEVLSAPIEK